MIAWFARNGVAANLLMVVIIVGGFVALPQITVELFPEISLDQVRVQVPYPGASPNEVEEGIILRVEEALEGVQGIRKITATALEGIGTILVESERGYDIRRLKEDVKTRVDAIATFPQNAERPIIEELILPRDILYVAIAGDADEVTLRRIAERARDDLVTIPGISQAELVGVKDFEIAIQVSEIDLRRYGLTFDDVMDAVRRSSIDMPGGSIRADSGEILLRTLGQAYVGPEFESIPLRTNADGTRILLGDVADVTDGFVDRDRIALFDGQPAAFILVRQVSSESPLDISSKVNAYVENARSWLPAAFEMTTFADASYYLSDRIALLVKNGLIGLLLVLLILTAFLRPLLAFFVAIGIPISFLGTFLIAPYFDVSVNLISLFAFILVLGIVVDDAIVVGESIFTHYQSRGPGVESAIAGSKRVSIPVTFGVLTTMVAFLPVLFVPGMIGKFFAPIPIVVVATLAWSLIECKYVLPYHLSLLRVGTHNRVHLNYFNRVQRRIADGLEQFVENRYKPFVRFAMRRHYLTLSLFFVMFALAIGLVGGGWVRYMPFPSVPSDYIQVELQYPVGTPIDQTRKGLQQLRSGMLSVIGDFTQEGHDNPIQHDAVIMQADTNAAMYLIEMSKAETRTVSAPEFAERWRKTVGEIPGVRSLVFTAEAGATHERPINVQIVGRDFALMQAAAESVRQRLTSYPAISSITDNFSGGKQEIQLKVKPRAEVLGLTAGDLGRQVRQAFFGGEAQRIQRGRNDVRVMVRYPREERESIAFLNAMWIHLPGGGSVQLSEVAQLEHATGFPTINRIDRRRVINITADVNRASVDFTSLVTDISENILPAVMAEFPGIEASLEGEAAEANEAVQSIALSTSLVFFIIYALLAIPLRSYVQPLIVMAAIPFAIVGAVFGHLITFQPMSILSMIGLVAAFGVVVNASLLMVDFINQNRGENVALLDAVVESGASRFRAIILTSTTTFAGLIPILLERSLQAQFLIPMATSLGFGVLFASLITLVLVPALYFALDDVQRLTMRAWKWSSETIGKKNR